MKFTPIPALRWDRWFAWTPVKCESQRVWLKWIWRKPLDIRYINAGTAKIVVEYEYLTDQQYLIYKLRNA